jgi:voltage-gated potassium channel
MSEFESPQPQDAESEAGDRPAKVPLTAWLLLRESLTAWRAAAIIAAFTVLITVAGGILERVFDRPEFPTMGKGLWFALQTVTTVGYGDVTPKHADGRFIGAVVMLTAIGFLAVITASVIADREQPEAVHRARGRAGAAVAGGQRTAGQNRGVARPRDAVGVV